MGNAGRAHASTLPRRSHRSGRAHRVPTALRTRMGTTLPHIYAPETRICIEIANLDRIMHRGGAHGGRRAPPPRRRERTGAGTYRHGDPNAQPPGARVVSRPARAPTRPFSARRHSPAQARPRPRAARNSPAHARGHAWARGAEDRGLVMGRESGVPQTCGRLAAAERRPRVGRRSAHARFAQMRARSPAAPGAVIRRGLLLGRAGSTWMNPLAPSRALRASSRHI